MKIRREKITNSNKSRNEDEKLIKESHHNNNHNKTIKI